MRTHVPEPKPDLHPELTHRSKKLAAKTARGLNRTKEIIRSKPSPAIDLAALAEIYNSPPPSHIAWEDLLEEARIALAKYELEEAELSIAAEHLAKAMHMLVEQQGGQRLEPHRQAEIERHVLDWCGFDRPRRPFTITL